MALQFRLTRTTKIDSDIAQRAVDVALRPGTLKLQPDKIRNKVELVAKAITNAPRMTQVATQPGRKQTLSAINIQQVANQAARDLAPSASVIPADIELALRRQGIDQVEPFAPGRPLVPFYGYDRRPRGHDFRVGRNIGTDTRPDRIPFSTLKEIIEAYDIAAISIRHIINDLRSMPLRWRAKDGYNGNVKKEIEQAKLFWNKPDGHTPFSKWLAKLAMDYLRYDAGALYRQRTKGGKLIALKVISGPTLMPLVDYYGDIPEPPAPAYQQFIQGIPWDWLTTDDIIYQPMWPTAESAYGVAPIETVLTNANTDMRLQLFFLQFFTAGAIPEMLLSAPEDQSDPDALAELQETWDDWMDGLQERRHGARWMPHGTEPYEYKQINQINPKIAEYVMRRTIAAFQLMPQDLGILDDVNRSTSDSQTDEKFRINTLPNTEHYEWIINSVTQEDLGLPVECHFDTGREAEDRLTAAEAHKIYVSIGAESPDEVREHILGLPVDHESRVPRLFDSDKLGPMPLSVITQSAGRDIDPDTLAPINVDIPKEPFIPAYGIHENITPGQDMGGPGTPEVTPDSNTNVDATNVDAGKTSKASDLTLWRRQSRERVKAGKQPRHFEHSSIDPVTYAEIWTALTKAESVKDVDAAFTKGDSPPKGSGPRPGPWGHLEEEIVQHYLPLILKGIGALLNPVTLARRWLGHKPHAPESGQTFMLSVQFDDRQLREVLTELHADSLLVGAKDAVDQLPDAASRYTKIVSAVDWSTWKPGDPRAAHLLAGTGFEDLLAEAKITLKGIEDVTRKEIGQILEQAIYEGWGNEQTAKEIDKVISDPSRAKLIARTETNRAMSLSSLRLYTEHGYGWDLVTAPNPCPVCIAVKAQNPHPTTDKRISPLHPRCRCAIAPHVEIH